MKKNIRYAILIAVLAAMPLAFTAGCARRHASSKAYVDDQTVSAKIKSDLLRDPVINASAVDVTSHKGEVQLSGFVASQQEKERAGQIAASVPGVTAVHNDLLVRTGR